MFTGISADSMNELAHKSYDIILNAGDRQPSRNGDVHFLNNVVLSLSNPRARHLYLKGRNSNIVAQIAETFWVLAGDDEIDPYLSFFLPRAKDYSDDGKTWRGAYGPRLYMYNQLQDAAQTFIKAGITTRHSVIQILLPEHDSNGVLVNQEGCEDGTTKDRPCNNELVFFCNKNKLGQWQLNLNVMQRSGDAIWGALNINVFEWTVLQELMLTVLNNNMDEDIVLGEYTHFVTNLHIYDSTSGQARDVLDHYGSPLEIINHPEHTELTSQNHKKFFGTGDVDKDRQFFSDLIETYSDIIKAEGDMTIGELVDSYDMLIMLLEAYGFNLDCQDNILYDYMFVVLMNIYMKKGITAEEINDTFYCSNDAPLDFVECLNASRFFKMEL